MSHEGKGRENLINSDETPFNKKLHTFDISTIIQVFSYTPPTIAVSCLCSTARLPTLSKGTLASKLTSRAVALSKSNDIEAKMECRVSVSYKVI